MSPFENNIFDLQPLEKRQLMATVTVDSGHILQINSLPSPATVTVNKISNGKVVVTINGTATGAQLTSGSGSGQFNQINIAGSAGNDNITILGNVTYNTATIAGGNGNDTLTGGAGADVVSGNAGNDTLDGGAGNDQIVGGADIDTANYSARTGNLTITLDNAANDGERSIGEADNVQTEEVLGGSGNDTMTGQGGDDFFAGGGGADVLTGGSGNDELTGSAGADNLQGQNGDDFLQAQNNDKDTVAGGTNSDGTQDFDIANIDGVDVASIAAGLSATQGVPTGPSPSDLDPTYGTGGKVVGPDLGFYPIKSAVDSQGRVYFVGTISEQNSGGGYGNDFVIARYNASGALDSTFGTGGIKTFDFTSQGDLGGGYNSDDEANGIAVGPDDSVYVIGESAGPFSSDYNTAVLSLKADGTFKYATTYDTSGDGFQDQGFDGAVQADGKLVVLGSAGSESSSGRVSRLLADGSIDNSQNDPAGNFASNGVVDFTFQSESFFETYVSVALQQLPGDAAAQRIVVGGTSDGLFALTRFLANGSSDSTFGTGGVVLQDFSTQAESNLSDIAVDANNNILAAGDAANFIAGLTTPGTLPPPNTDQGILAKYDANGTFITYASHDSVLAPAESNFKSAYFTAVTVDAQGRYVVTGTDTDDFIVARLNSNMQPDTTFSSTGFVTTDFNQNSDQPSSVRVLGGGQIVAAGLSAVGDGPTYPAIARYKGFINTTPQNGEAGVTGIEGFATYDEVHQDPPDARMQAIFNRISSGAKLYLLSQPDNNGNVNIPGTDGNDVVTITCVTGADGEKLIDVSMNGINYYYDKATTKRIEIHTGKGNDTITNNSCSPCTIPFLLDGGDGNDLITDNACSNILMGGAGKDSIIGNGGTDFIIGGADADSIKGGSQADLIIAGTTAYDSTSDGLFALLAEWSSTRSMNTKISEIRAGGGLNGPYVLNVRINATAFDDNAKDSIDGGSGNDWLYVRMGGSTPDLISSTNGKTLTLF